MAARIDAAAQCSLLQCFKCLFLWIISVKLLLLATIPCSADNFFTYDRHDLLRIGLRCERAVTAEFFRSHAIPEDIARCHTNHRSRVYSSPTHDHS